MEDNNINQPLDDASAFTDARRAAAQDPIIIKAVGVGGGGNNAVSHMFKEGIKNVSFVNINSDEQALRHSDVPNTLRIGDGLGAGNKPEKAKAFAEDATEEINRLFDDDTKMVFVTAGMGGGTGTGAAPVVARVAKERGLLTIGIVTIPFLFEGQVKIKKAIAGADEMAKYVDALLVINNERLTEIYGDLDFMNAFGKADDTLSVAARSISEIITRQGIINLDFNDVDTTLRDGGAAIISTGFGEGEGRVTAAIQDALNSPLLKNRDILGSKKLLFNLYFNPQAEDKFLMSETKELTQFIGQINSSVDVIWGVCPDESIGNQVKITILAAGFEITLRDEENEILNGDNNSHSSGPVIDINPHASAGRNGVNTAKFQFPQQPRSQQSQTAGMPQQQRQPQNVANPVESVPDMRVIEEYGKDKTQIFTGAKERSSAIILGLNQLDDDSICDTLERYPAYKRERRTIDSIRSGAFDSGQQNIPASTGSGKAFSF